MENVTRIYKLLLGLSFVLSLLISMSGISTVVTSVVLLLFATLVFVGSCCLCGEVIVDAMHDISPAFILFFLLLGILVVVAWVAGVGILELIATLFLWQVGESVLIWVASVVIVLWGVFYYAR